MHDRLLPASPNWYCSRCSDVSSSGLLGVGAKNIIYLIDVSAASCGVVGELIGHKDLVSGFSFCQHEGQSHLCVSSSADGSVRFWDSDTKSVTREQAAHQGNKRLNRFLELASEPLLCRTSQNVSRAFFKVVKSPVSAVHWSPVDRNLVVSGDEKGIVVCHWYHTGDTSSFFPEPRTIFCLTCSPHCWNSVAVGYKDGMIVLIDVSKKGEVTHRLRGHDDEIHSLAWSPSDREEMLYSRPEDSEATNGAWAEGETGGHLASGSKDQTVRIWSTARGKSVMTLKLPYLKKRGSAVDPGVKERLWLSVHWPQRRPTQLVSSCFGGELVMWDLTRSGKQKWTLLGSSSEAQNHSRIVFNVSSVHLRDGRELLISTSMDRDIKCWDLASLDCCWTLPTLGGFAYALTFSPVGTGCLALGVGDNMIRVWNTLTTQNQYDTRSFWQGIKSKVTALAWHPKREGSLAFGTDDGKVGIYDVFSNKPPQISSSYHRKTVYALAWGPPVPPLSFGAAGEKPSYSLYSCAGEGVILQHDVSKLSGEASNIDKLIRDNNDIKHKLSPHTDISWKPDGKVVAIGNEDGCIDVFQAPSLKLLCSIQQHHKIINTLRWHHDHSSPELHGLLASGSSNAIVYVHDLRSVTESPPERPVMLTEPFRRLCGHTAKITGMAWSPHHEARLVTVSYDGTAQVWDVLQEAALSNYRGHVGYLLSVDWSPVDPDVIWTGGKDFTVQEWRVSKQEFTCPPKGKKMVELKEKMKTKVKPKKKNKKVSGAGGAAGPETNGEPGAGGEKGVVGQGQSSEEDDDVSSSSSSVAPPVSAILETQRKSPAAAKSLQTCKDKPDSYLLKKKKPRSMLPLSTSMDHRPKEELLQDCVTLASISHSSAPPAGCVPGQGQHVHLGLFTDRPALLRMFEAEVEGHVEAGHFESAVYVRLWSGDLEGALQLATEKGELNDHLLSLAPMAGFELWSRTVEAFVKQLCLQEQYLKAASHLLSLNKLYEAVALLHRHKLYREAIALVKARLPADDPVLKELYTSWAAVLEKDGHLSAAAKCYLAAGASFDAAKVISRKNDVSSLMTAASLARISGEVALAQSLALRCAKDLAAAQDWVGAKDVLSSQEGLLVHRLHLCAAELLAAMLVDSRVVPQVCVSSHPWASSGKRHTSLQDRVRDVWDEHFGVSQMSSGHCSAGALLQDLKSVESPAPTANVPFSQVLLCSALHVSRSVLNWLRDDEGEQIKELWQAAAWPRDAGHTSVSAELCRLLFPEGDVGVYSTNPKDEEARAAAISLQAFVSYHRLYERWWSNSAEDASVAFSLSADEAKNEAANGGLSASGASAHPPTRRLDELDFDVTLLLSQPHAACQATQRAVGDVQERLAALVLQHSRTQREQLVAGEKRETETGSVDAEQRSDGQETFLSLSAKLLEFQKQLADLPPTVKMFPHPDVVECCLVLLHGSRSSLSVAESLQQQAKELLREYGTGASVLKASRRFLT